MTPEGEAPSGQPAGCQRYDPARRYDLVREGDVQACRENYVVLLRAGRRVGDVDVAKLILPAQPLADLGYGAHVERPAVLARLLQVGVEVGILRQNGAFAEFVVQFLAEGESNESVGLPIRLKYSGGRGRRRSRWNLGAIGIGFVGIVDAAQEVECRGVRGCGVKAEAARVHLAQVQELQGVAGEVGGTKNEKLGIQVAIVAESALYKVGNRTGSGEIVLRIDRTHVKHDLVVQRGMDGVQG